jgi:hypothetical protein
MYPGRLRPLAVNAINILYVGDAVSPQGLAMARLFFNLNEK